MKTPDNLKFTKNHEWAKLDGKTATIGITDYAQDQLGDVVFVELPKVGEDVSQGKAFGVVESVKAVSDCYAPLSGKIAEINEDLSDNPAAINQDCYGEGWIAKIELSNPDEIKKLMDAAAYEKYVAEESGE